MYSYLYFMYILYEYSDIQIWYAKSESQTQTDIWTFII